MVDLCTPPQPRTLPPGGVFAFMGGIRYIYRKYRIFEMPFLPKTKPRNSPQRRQKTSEDRAGRRFLDSKAWKDTRQAQLGEAPYCEACMAAGKVQGLVKNAHIDHIVPRSHGGAPLDTRNLQTLCKYHHDRKNGLEKNRGCLVDFTGEPGEYLPAQGEKERLIKLLIGYV